MHLCIYFYVYLSQAVSCPPCIGMEWDLFCRVYLVKELHLELMLVTSRVVGPPLPAEPLRSGHVHRCKNGPDLRRIARDRRLSLPKLRLGYGNPAHQEVSTHGYYWLSYSIFYACCAFMYIFLCVPVAGRIVPAMYRNGVGPLLSRLSSEGASLRAHVGH